MDATESKHGKLTVIVRYHLNYKQGDKHSLLSFGLGEGVAVNSIIGIPTLRQWGGVFDFSLNSFTAKSLATRFSLQYEATAQGLPDHISFTSNDFIRSGSNATQTTIVLATSKSITPSNQGHDKDQGESSVNKITETTKGSIICGLWT